MIDGKRGGNMPELHEPDVVRILAAVSGISEGGEKVSFPVGTEATIVVEGDPHTLEFYWDKADGGADILLAGLPEDQLELVRKYSKNAA